MQPHTPVVITSTVLSQIPGLVHGFTTRAAGDMKKNIENRKQCVRQLFGSDRISIAFGQQVHGTTVGIVTPGKTSLSDTDALVMPYKAGDISCLAVFSADCVPILLSDPVTAIVATVHAGWKGTLGRIAQSTVAAIIDLGAHPDDIRAWIGPHIAMCHYSVPKERVDAFVAQFGQDPKLCSYSEGAWRLDLGWANYTQLLGVGLKSFNIDARPTCTGCQTDTFFSYRMDSKETFGEMMGVIGYGYKN